MSNNTSEVFSIEEVTLENSHLLPEGKRGIYFVTAMQGENKNIIFIGIAENLKAKLGGHKRKMEFEFLNRMGYQINIFWVLLPEAISQKEAYALQMCYVRIFEPKLNNDQNMFYALQIEESKKQKEKWERGQYEYLEKQIENWQKIGEDQNTIIRKIWEATIERLSVNI
jgi:hypothetical protein